MTHNGYSLKRPKLKSNYIKILNALELIEIYGERQPTTKELQKIVGISHDNGFHKAVKTLVENGYVEKGAISGQLSFRTKAYELYGLAASTAFKAD